MRTLSLSLLFAVAACGDANGPPALQPASFALIEGAAQVDTVGRELKDMIALRVIATDGAQSVPNYPITWTTPDGGSVFATVVYSGSDGIARQRWTLGPTAGTQRVVARALDPETGAVLVDDTVTATGMVDSAWRFARHPEGSVTVVVGDSVWVWVTLRDRHGNPGASCVDGGARDRLAWGVDSAIARPDTARINGQGEAGTWLHGATAGTTFLTVADSRDKAWGFYGTCIAPAGEKEAGWQVTVTP